MRRERSLMYARKKQPGSTWSPYMHELRNSCAAFPRLLAYDIAEPCTSTIRCGSTAESVTVELCCPTSSSVGSVDPSGCVGLMVLLKDTYSGTGIEERPIDRRRRPS